MLIVKYNNSLLLLYMCMTLMKTSLWLIEAFPFEICNDDDDDDDDNDDDDSQHDQEQDS